MNVAQYNKFWALWKRCRAWYIAHGLTPAQADAKRGQLTREALGHEKSMSDWKAWTNRECDKVFGKFESVFDGGNLNAQIDAEDQPEKRRLRAQARAHNLSREIWPCIGDPDPTYIQEKKLRGICFRICKTSFEKCTDVQLEKVIGSLEVQRKRITQAPAEEIAAAHAESEKFDSENPF